MQWLTENRGTLNYTMVQVDFRPTPFKLVLKLDLSCLTWLMKDRFWGSLLFQTYRNLENALTLHKTEDNLYLHIHLPLQKLTCCNITKIDLLPCLL